LPSNLTDCELLQLMLSGNEEAFTALYRLRHINVYQFALHMGGSRTLAEDVTQEVFMILIREGRLYDQSRGSLSAYLCGIARNLLLRRLERDKVYVPIAEDGDECAETFDQFVAEGDPLRELTHNETIELVRQAVLSLPARYREVVVLCDLQEMSYIEAANILGCAIGTIRSRLHRARSLLLDKLKAAEIRKSGAEPGTESGIEKCNTKRCFA